MMIDTSHCNFFGTPIYMTTMSGTNSHWYMTGHDAIYSPAATSFRVYSQSRAGWNATTILNLSTTNAWNINWVGMYN